MRQYCYFYILLDSESAGLVYEVHTLRNEKGRVREKVYVVCSVKPHKRKR